MPQTPANRRALCNPTVAIIEAILKSFLHSKERGVARAVVDVHQGQWLAEEAESKGTYPPLVIRAAGPSFETPDASSCTPLDSTTGFSNIASCIDLMLEADVDGVSLDEIVEDHSNYAR